MWAWWITALLLVSLSMGLSIAINIFHPCLVRLWLFAGTCRFLAGLFTFLSRPLLSTSSELVKGTGSKLSSWLRKQNAENLDLSFATPYWAVKCGWSCIQMNGGKLVIWLKTDEGSELPLISFNVTHPGLIHPTSEIQKWRRARPLKAFH